MAERDPKSEARTASAAAAATPPMHQTLVGGAAAHVPERIGRYRIRRLVGFGGMGAVYEAVQESPRRTVALKVLNMPIAAPAAMRRFEYEAQLLARLRHPGIAQVFEAGTHSEPGAVAPVPYIAMEYIPGARPLTEYAAAKRLDARERLRLFCTVCDAVHHGHQKGIIHRDLKPANILADSSGQVKIIDFGVARATDRDTALATFETRVGQLVGTVQYMSPEQCVADPHDLDVRSDVYSLGVVLYELLCGRSPHDLAHASIAEAARVIQHEPPARPASIAPWMRGDAETIVLKALEKDRERRYESAAALAADIGRYLRSEPIHARRVGPVGRLVRWTRRNRALAAAVFGFGSLLAVVSATLVTSTLVAGRIAQENLRAAEDNFNLVKGLFASMGPDQLKRGLVDVEQLLDDAEDRLVADPPQRALTEADFREILGQGYMSIAQYAKAIGNFKRSLEIRERASPRDRGKIAGTLHLYAAALWWNGQYDQAEPLYRRSLEMRIAQHGPEHEAVAASLTHLAACCLKQGRTEQAEEHYNRALAMRRALHGPRSAEVAASINNLAKCVRQRGDLERAEGLFREALAMIIHEAGEGDLQTASAAHNLAECLLAADKAQEAAELFGRAVALRSARYPPRHHLVAISRLWLARARFRLLPGEEALAEARSALRDLEAEQNEWHQDLAEANAAVGECLMALGRPAEALPLLERARAIVARPVQPVAADLAAAEERLARCRAALERGGPGLR